MNDRQHMTLSQTLSSLGKAELRQLSGRGLTYVTQFCKYLASATEGSQSPVGKVADKNFPPPEDSKEAFAQGPEAQAKGKS